MVVRPVVLYGAECWPVTKSTEHPLHVMELCMLHWITGVSLLNHYFNDTIRWQMGIVSLTQRHLQWYGHVLRAAPGTVANTAYHFMVDGKRPSGHPKQRCRIQLKKI